MPPALVTRFAPSPTGHLHAGHAYSAGLAYRRARQSSGRFLLRIEDIDATRCRPELTDDLLADLAWLGLRWEEPVRRQSQHFDEYRAALDDLQRRGLLYPCFCTRKQVQEEIARIDAAPHGPVSGIEGPVYPGTCRHLSADERKRRMDIGENHALRLDIAAALASLGEAAQHLHWHDEQAGPQHATPDLLLNGIGDAVLARKDTPASYHLCVTLDDALQGITLIVRGEDLFAATHLHRLLQALFGLPVPIYAHHRLLMDADGARLAKRRGSKSLRDMRQEGMQPAALWRLVGLDPSDFAA